jgi:hypothetical protein
MKIIYKFKLDQEKEIEEIVTKKDETGKEFKVPEKIKKMTPRTFVLRRPTRTLWDDAQIYYAAQVSDLIKKGILSAVQLNKRYLNDGGILSEEQKKQYAGLYGDVAIKKTEYDKLEAIPEKDRTESDKNKSKELLDALVELMGQIQNVETAKDTVLNNTAEILARDKTVRWWMLNLAYEELGTDSYKPIFDGADLEAKNAVYNEMDEKQDDFEYQMVSRLFLATGLWYMGKAESQQDFDILIRVQESQEDQALIENKELIEGIAKETKEVEAKETPVAEVA